MPSRVAHFDPDASTEIDDADVRKAFDARPQLGEHPNVAYFSFDAGKNADIERTLRAIPGVGTLYSIPALAVTGARRFDETPSWAAPSVQPLSVKKLRLLAARAHCDVVVVVDYGYRTEVSANALAAFDALLLPALFLPFRELKIQSYVDAFVIDTRNGYLYGEATSSHEDKKSFQTIYADEGDVVTAQWGKLQAEMKDSLLKVFQEERTKAGLAK
jgi:hypothetical protein